MAIEIVLMSIIVVCLVGIIYLLVILLDFMRDILSVQRKLLGKIR